MLLKYLKSRGHYFIILVMSHSLFFSFGFKINNEETNTDSNTPGGRPDQSPENAPSLEISPIDLWGDAAIARSG